MGRDHFKKVFFSPYFQSNHYKQESRGGKLEKKIENWFKKILTKDDK